ncbi:hypothetical protein H5410_061100 [Solanum commersonii]|uniref:Mutator-like transposase n=1 Tax=Solanum commersonii TaxID=4109 RepID=A0A9J5W8L2_SOLCO|nr:hypothetical protein H5410_061100 [Solanum commersonii]
MLNDEFDVVDMNNYEDKIEGDEVSDLRINNPPTPIIGRNNPTSSQSSRVNNVRDDETGFYKEMTFKNKEELGLSTRDMSNQIHTKLDCNISYWEICKGMEHVMSSIRGTHENGYAVLNVYHYMIEITNPGSKMTMSLDENGRFKYLFVSYVVSNFYKAAKAYDRCKFNDHFNQIRDLVPKAAETHERIGLHTWRRTFCPRNRYNIMTSNIAESVNTINSLPLEHSWIVPLDILEREIPPPYIDPSKYRRMRYKRQSGVGESFPTRKNKCSVCKDFGHKRTTCPN